MSLSVKSKLITSFCAVAAMIAVVITVTSYNLSLMAEAVEEVDRSHGVAAGIDALGDDAGEQFGDLVDVSPREVG